MVPDYSRHMDGSSSGDELGNWSIDAEVAGPAASRRSREIPIGRIRFVSALTFLLVILVGSNAIWGASIGRELTETDIPPQWAPELRGLIQKTFSLSDEERRDAVFALEEIGERARPAIPFIIRLLRDPHQLIRWEVPRILASLRDSRAIEPLMAALNDTDTPAAGSAARALGSFPDPRVVAALLAVFHNPKMPAELRKDTAWSLRLTGDPRAIDALLAMVKARDARPDVRACALRELGRSHQPHVIGAVSDTFLDGHECAAVRISAAAALADLRAPEAAQTLAKVARNHTVDPLVRFWAAIDVVIVTNGAIEDLEVARALDIPTEMLPHHLDGELDEDARYTRLVAYHAVAERGKTFAVRSTARRLVRSIWARNWAWHNSKLDRNKPIDALVAVYFFVALLAWAVVYRRRLARRQFTLRSLMILTAILGFGMGIPTCFDAIVPLHFDDPNWSDIRERHRLLGEARNENTPVGLWDLYPEVIKDPSGPESGKEHTVDQ